MDFSILNQWLFLIEFFASNHLSIAKVRKHERANAWQGEIYYFETNHHKNINSREY